MARRSWEKNLAELFSREVQTPRSRVELARKCMEYAKGMTSTSVSTSLQFNRGQCAHLANKLEVAVQSAEACAPLNAPGVTAESVEIVKVLCRCAKEVETFIKSCRKKNWIQAAVILSNASEHVSALSIDLEFCTIFLRDHTTKAKAWQGLPELDALVKSALLKETVLDDQRALLSMLEATNRASNLSPDNEQLLKYLLGRLKHQVWEIDFSSLRQVLRLGSGSVGTVRKSTWLGAEVAEKMFYGSDHPSFRNEVEILRGLAHPNIVPLLGYAVDEGRCSIVMELMDGDLMFLMEEKLQRNPTCKFPFTTSEAMDMMLQSAEGMRYLHENKVIHRDLNSQHILVKIREGIDAEYVYAKVADFGLSKTKAQSSSYSNLTPNTGRSRWMAPELLPREENDIRARTELTYPFKVDVYSFGMVCYEILTGKVPFSTISSLKDVKQMVLNGDRPELPEECLPDLRSLIHACWEPDASRRPCFEEICKRLRCMKYLHMRVQTPRPSVELARKCMEYAKGMTSTSVSTSLQFNRGHCAHLANNLEVAVQSAEACALLCPPGVTAESVEIVKVLCRCAKEVETFIKSCRTENWIQAAVILSNASEHVSALSIDLEFCTIFLRNHTTKAKAWQGLAELDALVKSALLKETVLDDQRALLSMLEATNRASNLSAGNDQLLKYLLGRLKHQVWEIDFSSLKLVHRLGSGSVGMVRKSTWLGAEVAEKMFYGTDHPSFRNEVEILRGLAHPNIVPLLGYAVDEGRCSIVMELMDGDLMFLMEEKKQQNPTCKFPFTTSEAVDMMLQSAEGMRYLHENKVIHRDLKSQNILVKIREGIDAEYVYAKVADFGLSKTKEQSSSYSSLTPNIGTPRWMAPELLPREENDIRARTELTYPFKVDVYSFGMVCYEILTGKVPFSTISSFKDIMQMVLKGDRPELPEKCLPDLRSLIHACWEPDASRRPCFEEICKRLRCMKYLHMRDNSGITIEAVRRELEDEADLAAREPSVRQMESKTVARRLAATAVRALICNSTEMEPIQGQRNMFRANMGGGFVAVRKFERSFEAPEMQIFEEQIVQLWKLNHENVVKMVGFRLEAKEKVVVFEYAPLGSLRDRLHREEGAGSASGPSGPILTWMQRVKIALGIARALDYLHGRTPPIICGSIKSSNILMFDDDVPKIGEFDLLQHLSGPRVWLGDDIRAPWAGLERAPELFGTANTPSRESDVYAIGMLLLELLTDTTRMSWESVFLMNNFTEDMVPSIIDRRISSNLPAKSAAMIGAVLAQCLRRDAERRPNTEALIGALRQLVTERRPNTETLIERLRQAQFRQTEQIEENEGIKRLKRLKVSR